LTCRLWQEQKITPFQATPRLVIDYEAHDDLTILALAQVCAYRMNLEIPVQALRSFSSTREKPRKMLHFDFGSEQVGRSEQELTACFRAHFGSRNLQQVAIGNESLFTLPDNSFILTYNRLGWIDDVSIGRLVTSVVLVSGFKAVIRLDVSQTVEELKSALEVFARQNPGDIRQLLDNSAGQIWTERIQHMTIPSKDQQRRDTSQARAISLDSLLQFCPERTILVNSLGGGAGRCKAPLSIARGGGGRG